MCLISVYMTQVMWVEVYFLKVNFVTCDLIVNMNGVGKKCKFICKDENYLDVKLIHRYKHMSHFAYACKTEGKNGISHLISALCINCLISIPEYSRIIDYSIIWMCIWCGLLQKLYKIKKSELLNSKVYSKV